MGLDRVPSGKDLPNDFNVVIEISMHSEPIKYELTRIGSNEVIKGDMMPMVASDGPHYGDNVKLAGPGKYRVKFTVYAPSAPENAMGKHFGRHTDRATGVRPWFKPVEAEWEFTYAGVGKKGGY